MKLFNKPQIILIIIAFLSFLGFLDAAYLSIKSFQGAIPACSITEGCEKVLTSKYSKIGTIPISLPGAVFYVGVMGLSILILQIPYSHSRTSRRHSREGGNLLSTPTFPYNWIPTFARMTMRKSELTKILILLILSGFLISVILFLIQAFVLQSFCKYCLFSEAVSTLLMISSIFLLRSK